MVTARSFGAFFRAARQRAARNSSAVESGPPETARITFGAEPISANSFAASRAEIGATSAARTLLFPLDALLEDDGGAGIFASDFIERGTCRVFLAQRGQRLAEPEQGIRCFASGFVFRRNDEERLGSVTIALALKLCLAE